MRTLKDRVRNWLRGARGEGRVRNPRGGFTLMELIVVIAIISILAGISMPVLRRARIRAQVASAQSMIASLGMALSMYNTDHGVYPQSADGYGHQVNGNSRSPSISGYYNLVKALTVTTGGGPYMEFRGDDLDKSDPDKPVLLDPWGRAYVYVSRKAWHPVPGWFNSDPSQGPFHPHTASPPASPNVNHNTFNIFSLGPDGKTYREVSFADPGGEDWDLSSMYDHINDGHTAAGDINIADRRWLLDDINNW